MATLLSIANGSHVKNGGAIIKLCHCADTIVLNHNLSSFLPTR